MKTVFHCVFILTISPNLAECYRVLMVWTLSGRSHYILGNALGKGLAEAGHDITMVSPYEDKVPPKNGSYRSVVLTGFVEEFENVTKQVSLFHLKMANSPLSPYFIQRMVGPIVDRTFSHTNVRKLLTSGEQFDIVMIEHFANDALRTLAHHFNAHLVIFSTQFASSWANDMVANPTPLVYIPEIISTLGPNMNFLGRTINLVFYSIRQLIVYGYVLPAQDAIRKTYFPNGPSVYETLHNCSIVLLNGHESFLQAIPLVPNMIPIGGYHVGPSKKIPQDLQKILDNAIDGIVYVSMGSHLQSNVMPKDKLNILMNCLGTLKQKVLWKWEDNDMPNKSVNIETRMWFPQSDILAHPNVKLFISHGGMGGITEAIYHAKPTLIIPVFYDQMLNALWAEEKGYAKMINFEDPKWSETRFNSLLREVLDNPRYTKRAQEISRLFQDRPQKPMESAIYWTEYVVRTNGAHHLRVLGTEVPWYQYFLLDVMTVLVLAVLAITFTLSKVFPFIVRVFVKTSAIKVKKS